MKYLVLIALMLAPNMAKAETYRVYGVELLTAPPPTRRLSYLEYSRMLELQNSNLNYSGPILAIVLGSLGLAGSVDLVSRYCYEDYDKCHLAKRVALGAGIVSVVLILAGSAGIGRRSAKRRELDRLQLRVNNQATGFDYTLHF